MWVEIDRFTVAQNWKLLHEEFNARYENATAEFPQDFFFLFSAFVFRAYRSCVFMSQIGANIERPQGTEH